MPLTAQLKRWILGSDLRNEYVCLEADAISDPLRAMLVLGNERIDVTDEHFLLGYKPLLIGVSGAHVHELSEIVANAALRLVDGSGQTVASLDLALNRRVRLGEDVLAIFEGRQGRHKFLSRLHQALNRAHEAKQPKSVGNIALEGNLYDQVRIGYAHPRVIAVISLGERDLVNFFPTDLHGPFGEHHYASSLRIGGQACAQVQQLRRLALSTVEAASFRNTYALGKNHMRPLTDVGHFEVAPLRSATFGLPLPKSVLGYRELERVDGFDAGIHRIHLYRVVHRVTHPSESAALTHVHRYYAQWREARGLSAPWLLR